MCDYFIVNSIPLMQVIGLLREQIINLLTIIDVA